MATQTLFRANDGTHGDELWVTGGSAIGTYMVEDIDPGAAWAIPRYAAAPGTATGVFSVFDGTPGFELWVSDGSAAGTAPIETSAPNQEALARNIMAPGTVTAVFSAVE